MNMQLEADRRLLKFLTYEDYLDSFVTCQDLTNLQSSLDARFIAELGYRSSGDTLTREQFYKRLEAVKHYFFPKVLPTDIVSKNLKFVDTLLLELARREEGNRTGKLATIIFLRHFTKAGFEVSGYIDFADRLQKQDWLPIFQGKKRLWPRLDDLSYFHWRNNKIRKNNSLNFKAMIDPQYGLVFQCWHDRKTIIVNPIMVFNKHWSRTTVPSERYEHIVLYDHMIRRRC